MHGNLAYAWDDGDTAGRRFAAVSLIRINAATQLEVAEAFAVKPATVRRWDAQHADAGVAGLVPERKGPKRKSKLTGDIVAAIRLREGGAFYRAAAAATGVSEGSVRNALNLLVLPTLTATILAPQPVPMIHSLRSRSRSRRSKEGRCLRSIRVARMIVGQRLALSWRSPVGVPVWPIRARVGPNGCWRGSGCSSRAAGVHRVGAGPVGRVAVGGARVADRAGPDRARGLWRVAERVLRAGHDVGRGGGTVTAGRTSR